MNGKWADGMGMCLGGGPYTSCMHLLPTFSKHPRGGRVILKASKRLEIASVKNTPIEGTQRLECVASQLLPFYPCNGRSSTFQRGSNLLHGNFKPSRPALDI
jgi:hypothetical protein